MSGMTQQQVADILGLTKNRVNKIEIRARKKLEKTRLRHYAIECPECGMTGGDHKIGCINGV